MELVEPFHYGINFVTHDDTVLHLKASVFGTSPSKLALYLIIYYIEMDLSTRKNGKIRPKMYKDGTKTLDSCWYQSLHKTSVLYFIKNGTSLYLGVSTGDKAEWVIYFAELSWFTSSLNTYVPYCIRASY